MPDLTNNVNVVSSQERQGSPALNQSHSELANDQLSDSSSILNGMKPELLTISIAKGTMGFGFTIADSAYGQRVKQILDKARCKTLQENDILVEINNRKVKDMVHSDVVNVLKECPRGQNSTILVQRGGMLTPSRGRRGSGNRSPQLGKDLDTVDNTYANVPRTQFYSPAEKEKDKDKKNNNTGAVSASDNKDAESKDANGDKDTSFSSESTVKSATSQEPPDVIRDGHAPVIHGKSPSRGGSSPAVSLESQNRNAGLRPRTPSEGRSKTPTPELKGEYPSRYGNETQAMDGRHNLMPGGGYGYYAGHDRFANQDPFLDTNYRADYDPRRDNPFGYSPSKREFGDRTDYTVPTGRSRTPGPEFMRGRSEDDPHFRSRPPEMARSKTPTPKDSAFGRHNISGTPDFIPASLYKASQNNAHPQEVSYRNHPDDHLRGQRPRSDYIQDFGKPFANHTGTRIPSSQSFAGPIGRPGPSPDGSPGMSAYGQQYPLSPDGVTERPGHQGARKQSTSFENEEPVPSNLTRVPHWMGDTQQDVHLQNRNTSRFAEEERYLDLTVLLKRQDTGFGFRIVGGTEEGSQVSVGHIVPAGAADLDGRLRTNDEIVSIDGVSVIGSSHHRVVTLMGQCGQSGIVGMGIRRRLTPAADSPHRMDSYPVDVTVNRRENEGFGFVIISSVTKQGSTIGRIIDASPAERCGRLHVGDRILKVNGVDIMGLHHEEVVSIIKDSGYSVTLTIGPPHDDTSSNASSQRGSQGSMINAMAYPAHSESDISRRSEYSPFHQPPNRNVATDRYMPATNNSQQPVDKHRDLIRQKTMPQINDDREEDHFYQVELHRGSRGFGFSIRGGREFNSMPLYVLRIADSGAAHMDGRLRVGDQLIEINGHNTTNMTHAEAIELIQNGGSSVRMLVKRTGKLPPQLTPNQSSPAVGLGGGSAPTLTNGPLSQSHPSLPPNSRHDHFYYNYNLGRPHPDY